MSANQGESRCSHQELGIRDFCFICEFPLIHTWDSGKTFNSGGLSVEDAEWLAAQSQELSGEVIETGAGLSTLIFLSAGFSVTSYINDAEVVKRVEIQMSQLRESRIWRPQIGLSGDLLPAHNQQCSIALIDGGHGFPIPFVDFYFMNRNLVKGGKIFVDDAQLYAPRELIFQLKENQPFFELCGISPSGKTYAFEKKTSHTHYPDFGGLARDKRLRYQKEDVNQELKRLRSSVGSDLGEGPVKEYEQKKRWPRIL